MNNKMKKITIQIPKKYNDGEKVEDIFFEILKDKLLDISGGFTQKDSYGFWKDEKTGKIYKDDNLEITTITSSKNIIKLKELMTEVADILKQEAIYFEIQEADVSFIERTPVSAILQEA